MNEIGQAALLLAFVVGLYSLSLSLYASAKHWERGIASAARGGASCFGLTTVALLCLLYAFVTSDFRLKYVYENSNLHLPLFYKIAGLWAGQAGSLLFWNWILVVYLFAVLVLFHFVPRLSKGAHREKGASLLPQVVSVLLGVHCFFLLLHIFVANPFETMALEGEALPFDPGDGRGLNPLLQHPAMVIHPPILYIGYVGFTVPFAFAVAALLHKQVGAGAAWLRLIRKWTLFTWLFLGSGVLLGARWAYVELGWGGYWGWDPVENASLLPWLTATAFIHSIMIQERKGMLKIWNMALIGASFFLSIFGTFLTRSGIVSSVHAFATSNIGSFFSVFLLIVMTGFFALMVLRRKELKSEAHLESLASRESAFLFNNLLFLLACFAVLWGTLFPVLSEAIQGEKITVGPPFFNKVMLPIGLLLLFLMGAGPLFAWKKTPLATLRRFFLTPSLGALFLVVLLVSFGMRDGWALVSFGLCAFVTGSIVGEFARGAKARSRTKREHMGISLFKILTQNRRRYGGYLVHFSIVLIFVGITGSALKKEVVGEVGEGESLSLGRYILKCKRIWTEENPNYSALRTEIEVKKGGKMVRILSPEKRFYPASEQGTTEVALKSGFREDLYVVISGAGKEGKITLSAFVNPLVIWIWIGGILFVLATLFILGDFGGKAEKEKT